MSFYGSTEWMQGWRSSDRWWQTVPRPGDSDKKRSFNQRQLSSSWYDERWRTRWSQTLSGLHPSDLLNYFNDTMYVVPFLRYSASKNGVTLKLEVGVVQDHCKWCHSIIYAFLFVGLCTYSYMLYHFQAIWCWIIMTLKRSLKVIQTSTNRKLGCSFLFAFHSNYVHIFNRLWDIPLQK